MLDPELLKILVCPLGKAELRLEKNCLVCTRCGPRFAISREGYPNMLIEEAELPPGIERVEDLPCYRETLRSQQPT